MVQHGMRRHWPAIVAVLLAATSPLAGAAAQERDLDREVPDGRVFAGETGTGGEPARFAFTLQGGQAIDLAAEQVEGSDPAVKVLDAASGEVLAENDDFGGTLASQVRLFSEATRRVRVEVRNAALEGGDAAVRFNLVLRPSSYRPKPLLDLALGEERSGTLASNDEQLFRLRGQQGQVWVFTLASAEGSTLDPALEIYAGDNTGSEALAGDDDGGGGLNSRLRFVVPETGDYVLRAYGVGTTDGAYALAAAEGVPIAPAKVETIGFDAPATATIDGDVRERFYRLSDAAKAALAASPGPVIVEMSFVGESEGALDPIVAVGFETPLGFSSVLSDDDSAGGTNARLTLDASMLTETWLDSLRIKASGFLETSGEYELRVRPAGQE